MLLIYNLGLLFYALMVRLLSPFNSKARLFAEGQKHVIKKLAESGLGTFRPIWFHFASLGEFEQGRPVLESLKARWPDKKFIITFFSPSGYEIRKNYADADGVFYLPLDTASNAKKFVSLINPELAIFTKYEFWFHYFKTLRKSNIPLYIISGIFRPKQAFFSWYGGFYRQLLTYVTFFFVQNEESALLLKSIDLKNVLVTGDTRFDRVSKNAAKPMQLPIIERFCEDSKVLVCGSSWPDDEKIIAVLARKFPDWKYLIAPHVIDDGHIQQLTGLFPDSILYSQLTVSGISKRSNVLIIDNIGMLSALYQYGNLAYIGGGFGAGIHNTLEAAAFGLPVIFGPEYAKFNEAKELIALGAARSISSSEELVRAFILFSEDDKASGKARKYVNDHTGATNKILTEIARSRNA